MATESSFIWDESFVAGTDMSVVGQFRPVKLTATRTVSVCTAAADAAVGVLQNNPKVGEAALVRFLGISKMVSDGSGTAIAAGDQVGVGAAGVGVKKATAAYGTLGRAIEASTASGTIISVILLGPSTYVAPLG